MPTTKKQMISWYRAMQLIRQCEEQLARCHQRGLVHGACHTYVGQEAIAVGVCAHLHANDVVFSTHRGHGHALAKGLPPVELIAELFGRDSGCSRGRGGSMHLFAPEVGLMGTTGIVGPWELILNRPPSYQSPQKMISVPPGVHTPENVSVSSS